MQKLGYQNLRGPEVRVELEGKLNKLSDIYRTKSDFVAPFLFINGENFSAPLTKFGKRESSGNFLKLNHQH
ncbi:unnamed protein product [Allacma fusca]|uniref:Uncharacterized protein n=1 Tax=Allacma fusca TaxID=39272 RepID=A0A8J2J0S0_9HEXA|nr:unnamed protein product [Allacma fusca]